MKSRPQKWLIGVAIFDQILVAAVLAWTWGLVLYSSGRSILIALLLVPFWTQLHRYFGLYDSHRLEGWRVAAARTITASTVGFALTSAVLLVIGLGHQVWELSKFTVVWVVVTLAFRGLVFTLLRVLRRQGVDFRSVCVIGSWESTAEIAKRFHQRPEWGLRISAVGVGPLAVRKFYRIPDDAVLESTFTPSQDMLVGRNLVDVLRTEVMDEILIICRPEGLAAEGQVVEFCRQYGLQCRVRLLGEELESTPVEYIPGHITWNVHNVEANTVALVIKRCVDIVLSALALIVLSPLFLLFAILVKLSSPGPVFFKQTRLGLRGRKFAVVKFRTMVDGAESMLHLVAHRNIMGGPVFKDAKDVRVTDIGRILRRFSLDELPQMLNVLKGDMSLVGPRPLPVHESNAIEGRYRRRFNMKPGITCSWQVQGRSEIGFTQWMELDVAYVDNWSLREDMKLLLQTIPTVFSGRGAY